MPARSIVGVFCLLLLLPHGAHGYREQFRVTSDHRPLVGAEVCFFRASGPESAFTLFFSYGSKIGCLPADKVLDMPPGLWHIFARHADGFVSATETEQAIGGPPRPEAGFATLELPVQRAAVLDLLPIMDLLKAQGITIGVWIASTADSLSSLLPLIPGEARILVPANIPFVPIAIRDGKPYRVGQRDVLGPGEKHAMTAFWQQPSNTADVLFSIHVDDVLKRKVDPTKELIPPVFMLVNGNSEIQPLFPITRPLDANDSLLIFKNVPPGVSELKLSGEMWEQYDTPISLVRGDTRIVQDAVPLTPAGVVIVHVSVSGLSAPISANTCAGDQRLRHALLARLLSCKATVAKTTAPADCTEVAQRKALLDTGSASTRFESVPVGSYVVELSGSNRNRKPERAVFVEPGRATETRFEIDAFVVSGTVRKAQKPVSAHVIFMTGDAITDPDTGQYTALLDADPLTNSITVAPCDGSQVYRHLVKGAILQNSVYDIEIPARTLNVHVSSRTRDSVGGAYVYFAPIKSRDPDVAFYQSEKQRTSDNGMIQFTGVPVGPVRVCGAHDDIGHACVDTELKPDDTEKAVTLVLDEQQLRHGRILDPRPQGLLAWVSRAGTITEQLAVPSDGRFSFSATHTPDEYVIYVSAFHPMAILHDTAASGEEWRINLPVNSSTSFQVVLPSNCRQRDGFVGLWIGTEYVPLEVFAMHQQYRGGDVELKPDTPIEVRDIASSAQIFIALGPDITASGEKEPVDPFPMIQYQSLPKIAVQGNSISLCPDVTASR